MASSYKLELARFSILLTIQDRARVEKTTFGGTPHRKNVYWEGGHHTYFVDKGDTCGGDTAQHRKMKGGDTEHTLLMGGTIGVRNTTQHRKKKLSCGWVGGPS